MKRPSWLYWTSPLGLLNMLLLQWFGFRLAAVGDMTDKGFVRTSWGIVRWVLPMTGWWSPYIFLGRARS